MTTELTKKGRMAIAKFLTTEAGEELKGFLAYLEPSVSVSPDAHIMHFTSGQTQGWSQCVKELEKLSTLKGMEDGNETDYVMER